MSQLPGNTQEAVNLKMREESRIFKIDVVIVTRNRYSQLLESVGALCAGVLKPTTLIIVDASELTNKKVVDAIGDLCEKKGIRISYYKIAQKGVGYSRNVGLGAVKLPYFAFIDDDEYVPKNWLKNVTELFKKYPDIQVLAGPKIPTDRKNYWHRVWRALLEKEFGYIGPIDTLPSGNSIYLTSYIKKHSLKFDQRFKQCSEDQAFSYELRKLKTNIFFHKILWVKHDSRRDLIPFAKQWFYYGVNKYLYHRLYLGSGSLFQPSKFFMSLRNFKKTFPYIGSLPSIDILPGIIFLNIMFLVGYLYSFTGLGKIIFPK